MHEIMFFNIIKNIDDRASNGMFYNKPKQLVLCVWWNLMLKQSSTSITELSFVCGGSDDVSF